MTTAVVHESRGAADAVMNDRQASSDAFRDVMSGLCSPVAVVTTMATGQEPHGTTVSAFTSLSLNPPMVLAALDRQSELLSLVRKTERFGVNILTAEQAEIAKECARKGNDKFRHLTWWSERQVPRLDGISGWLVCTVSQLVEGGDHVIALGAVVAAEHSPAAPLTYHSRKFGTHIALQSGINS